MTAPDQLETLLHRTAEGDREAFAALYQHSSQRLYGLLLHWLKERELAADVLQEGYIKIWLKAGEFQYRKGSPMAWMFSVMRNQAIDLMRQNQRQPSRVNLDDVTPLLADPTAGPQQHSESRELQARIQQCLQGLHAQQQRAIRLVFFHDLSHTQAAEQLGLPLGTVKTWIRRGLLAMRETY